MRGPGTLASLFTVQVVLIFIGMRMIHSGPMKQGTDVKQRNTAVSHRCEYYSELYRNS